MGRQPCCDRAGLKRGPWTTEEDRKLMNFIINNGIHCWRMVPKLAGLLRCGKSCRLRWINYLRPDLKRGTLSELEEDQIIELHSQLGNRWSKIASHFPGRTDNEIKNHWNTRIKKKLKLLGVDPNTHKHIVKDKQHQHDLGAKNDQCNNNNHVSTNDNIQEGWKNKDDPGLENNRISKDHNDQEIFHVVSDTNTNTEKSASDSNCDSNSLSYEHSGSVNPDSGLKESSFVEGGNSSEEWVDGVDSMLLWDCFSQQDDLFFLSGNNKL